MLANGWTDTTERIAGTYRAQLDTVRDAVPHGESGRGVPFAASDRHPNGCPDE